MYNNPKVGDWVRFYQGGKFVIGCVEYINKEANYYPYEKHLQTDVGTVGVSDVLEARPGLISNIS